MTSFSSFFAPPSEVAVLFNSNLSRRCFLGQLVDLDSLHRIRFWRGGFCSYVIFLLRDQWLIERLGEAMGSVLVCNKFLPIPSTVSFHMKKKWLCCPKFTSIKTLLTLELSQYLKSGSICFPQASLLQPAATAAYLETPCVCVLACPTRASSAWVLPQGRWFCSLNLWLPSGTAFGEIARWPAEAQAWTQTWTLQHDQRVVKVSSPPKSQHKLCGVWILLSPLLMPNLIQAKQLF